ncbi:MAG: hypothetical protein DMF20_09755 [Verrucomicrobia bacterium]|nr:MAG: hypothetical protein DMF20_09755 [Verrucomicrobiota bacterium]
MNTNVVHNTYVNKSVTNNMTANRASFNGPNGVNAQPTAEQKAAAQNAKKMPPTSQQLARQQAAAKDRNLQASVNKGKPNPDAIKSFNKNAGEGAGQGKGGAQEVGAAGGAGAGKKPGNLSERQGTGAGKGGNQPSNVTERNLKGKGKGEGAGAGNAGGGGNKVGAANRTNNQRNLQGNQTKMHTGKRAGTAGAGHPPRAMNQMSHNPQMGARNAQTGGKHPPTGGKPPQMGGGGNRPKPSGGQQQGNKKKPGQR